MAKVDNTDPALFMNPAAFSQVRADTKTKGREVRRKDGAGFFRIFDDARTKAADELDPISGMPASEEAANFLMDEVRSAGDILKNRPFPEEIIRYKQAVRNFMHFVVKNSYTIERDEGIPNFLKPGFKGRRGTDEARSGKGYDKIKVIDTKLENLAAMLLASQVSQLELLSRLEEITGLLVDIAVKGPYGRF